MFFIKIAIIVILCVCKFGCKMKNDSDLQEWYSYQKTEMESDALGPKWHKSHLTELKSYIPEIITAVIEINDFGETEKGRRRLDEVMKNINAMSLKISKIIPILKDESNIKENKNILEKTELLKKYCQEALRSVNNKIGKAQVDILRKKLKALDKQLAIERRLEME